MEDIYEVMKDLLEQKQHFVMTTILTKSGSAPREEGTKMLVNKDLDISGTIGGGLLEAMVIKLASKAFRDHKIVIENFNLSNQEAASLGMVCGGNVKVLIEYVDCNNPQKVEIYRKAVELKKAKIDYILITKISASENNANEVDSWICTETGLYGKESKELLSIIRKIRENYYGINIHEVDVEKDKFLIEPFFNYESAYIIGAGHVAQKIADLLKMLDFYTVVVDDRDEFANKERFHTANEIKVIPSFDYLSDHVTINCNSYIIIVTRGHAYDKEVVAQMLRTNAKYIGMIGSKSKREFTYNSLLDDGFKPKDLERIHSPIGIEIYAQTPEEIAVSIAAELIKVKRGPQDERI